MNAQPVDLYQPIVATRVGAPPLTLRVGVTLDQNQMLGGPQQGSIRPETYVLVSALPEELQRRIELAVQALVTGM